MDMLLKTFVCSFLWTAFMPAISFTMSHSHSGSLFAGYPVETSTLVTGEKEALEGNEVKYFDLTNSPINGKTPEYNHYREVESQFFSFLSKDNVNRHAFSLTKVEYVVNPALFKRFRAAQRRMAEKQSGFEKPVLGFHGTEEDNIISICNEGFRQPDHPKFEKSTDVGWYGNGIYFSQYPRFSMNYMKKSCKLLLCKVLQGKGYISALPWSDLMISHSGSLFAGYLVKTPTLVTGEKEALEGSEVKYFDLTNSPINGKTPEYNHYREVESQFFSFLSKDNVNRHTFSLTKVEYVVNPTLFKRFRAAQRRMAKNQSGFEKPVLGFHGTEEDNIISICNEGFRQPDHPEFEEANDVGWYGNGIYFSQYPRFSMNYVKRSCKLLLCKVLQGKIFKCEKRKLGAPKEPRYDSHVDPFGKEIVIYQDDCILPCYIVHFDISGRFKHPDDGASPQDDDHTLSQYMKEMDMNKGEEFPGF